MSPTPDEKSKKLFVRLSHYYRPHLKVFLLGYFFLILAALSEPLIPSMMKILLDHAGQQAATVKPIPWPIWGPPIAVIVLFAGRALLGFAASVALGSANNKAVTQLQNDGFARMLNCDLSLFQKEQASSLINTLRNECNSAGGAFTNVIQDGGRNLLTVIGLSAYLFWLNWRLTLLVVIIMPIIAILVKRIGKRMRKIHQSLQLVSEQLNYAIEENTYAHRLIRLHGASQAQKNRFARMSESFRNQMTRSLVASAFMTPITQIAASLALALILSLALQQNEAGQVTVGDFAAYITAMLMLISPLKGLGDVFPNVHRGSIALKRVFGILDSPLEPNLGTHAAAKINGKIDFVNISKTYPNTEHPAITSISLNILPNQMVALVGASGSGKTTLANMLPRFISPDSGVIKLDGVDITAWELTSLRNHIAMVSQDTILINDTVLANVSIGDDKPNMTRAQKALENAYLWQHIESLPHGIMTQIGHNGNTLSGGQRQRLAIARAFYKASSILILDEATSALDSESEQLVQAAITQLTKTCTTLVIAHRLSTVKHADLIVVMEAGKIVEQGPYQELIEKDQVFARLVKQQLS
jgi:ATP-binding cassette, subfamily B, bacterial MsbA